MAAYDTVSQAVNELKQRGYTLDFNLKGSRLECQGQNFNPKEFEITEFHRFEGNSDPGDEAVVYAIESKSGMKGVLVNVNQQIKAGQVLGLYTIGKEMEFRMFKDEEPMDSREFLECKPTEEKKE